MEKKIQILILVACFFVIVASILTVLTNREEVMFFGITNMSFNQEIVD